MKSRPASRVALTGGIATGKSTCMATLVSLGVATIDADELARQVVEPGTEGFGEIVKRFGAGVLGADGSIDRVRLGALVFADIPSRRALEAIVHPRVYAAIQQWFALLDQPLGVADIPLLYETDRAEHFDAVIVAACSPEQQLERLLARDGLSEADARARIDAQLPIAKKVARADYVIDTSGTLDQTRARTQRVWEALESRFRRSIADSRS